MTTNNDKQMFQKRNSYKRLIINAGAFLSGFIAVFSGFLIQFSYHMGQHGAIDIRKRVLDVNYSGWTIIHKSSILLFSVFIIFHIVQHWSWYTTILSKNLITKNKQVFILTIIFLFVAITGYIPWIIDLTVNNQTTRKIFLEIHDKLTIILFVFITLHVVKRLKWFMTTMKRIRID